MYVTPSCWCSGHANYCGPSPQTHLQVVMVMPCWCQRLSKLVSHTFQLVTRPTKHVNYKCPSHEAPCTLSWWWTVDAENFGVESVNRICIFWDLGAGSTSPENFALMWFYSCHQVAKLKLKFKRKSRKKPSHLYLNLIIHLRWPPYSHLYVNHICMNVDFCTSFSHIMTP